MGNAQRKRAAKRAALQSAQAASSSGRHLPRECSEWGDHQGAGRIRQRAYDVKRSASAVGLLQRPVAHVQLQPQQNAVIGDLCIEGLEGPRVVILGLRALVLGKDGERSSRKPPLTLHPPRPGFEAGGRLTEAEIDVTVGIHHRTFDQEVRIDEVTASAADEPSVDTVNVKAGTDRTKRAVVAALGIEGELVPIPLRFGTDHAMPLRTNEGAARIAN